MGGWLAKDPELVPCRETCGVDGVECAWQIATSNYRIWQIWHNHDIMISLQYHILWTLAWLFGFSSMQAMIRYDMIGIFLEGPCSLDSLHPPWGLSLVPAAAQTAWGREAHRLASHWFEFRFRGVEASWDLLIHPQYLTTLKGLHTAKTPCCPDLVAVGSLGKECIGACISRHKLD